jgi:CBS domain-containing protein
VKLADDTLQRTFPVVDGGRRLVGVLSVDVVRAVVAEDPAPGLVVAQDLLSPDVPELRDDESVQRALDLFLLQHVDELPVVSADRTLVGLLDRRSILEAYRTRIAGLRRAPVS